MVRILPIAVALLACKPQGSTLPGGAQVELSPEALVGTIRIEGDAPEAGALFTVGTGCEGYFHARPVSLVRASSEIAAVRFATTDDRYDMMAVRAEDGRIACTRTPLTGFVRRGSGWEQGRVLAVHVPLTPGRYGVYLGRSDAAPPARSGIDIEITPVFEPPDDMYGPWLTEALSGQPWQLIEERWRGPGDGEPMRFEVAAAGCYRAMLRYHATGVMAPPFSVSVAAPQSQRELRVVADSEMGATVAQAEVCTRGPETIELDVLPESAEGSLDVRLYVRPLTE